MNKIQELLEIIKEVGVLTDVDTLDYNKPLKDQKIDSLDMANIFLNIQEKYNIEISIEDADQLKSIYDIANFIDSKL
ncbi:TPA: acyl carrier protein [Campylobacter coli]|uniref:Acyl carrier protein n=1 Tax=Campylobacter coli TaxID=195 RepID=A0A644SCQ7_CAMCO|nr:acyl carrier protein [Campylobacter coli]EAH7181848.1 acyl carrier protein [Campylobacter coli]EAH7501126.1 acyl carrier protein [Campylobacter coli]EAH8157936.1 acyl carrier protein [Campylobacter coli]EAI4264080.1 acyl carrier protein [Campylobacter coli]EAI5447062.1 acyl carrier protein [Campylobacter coli]